MPSLPTRPALARAPSTGQTAFSLELPQNRLQRRPGPAEAAAGTAPPHPGSHYGIDEVVEDGADDVSHRVGGAAAGGPPTAAAVQKPRLARQFSGVPDPRSPPRVVDSGVAHDLIHVNCVPMPGVAGAGQRLVATLFYTGGKAAAVAPDSTAAAAATPAAPAVAAPLADAGFPLELPQAEPETPRDGFYGAHVSPICIAAFLHLMSTFPGGRGEEAAMAGEAAAAEDALTPPGYGSNLSASHRFLDRPVHPRVVEVVLGPAPALALADLRRHEQLYRFEREWGVEVVLQPDTVWRRHPRLVVFDMDSTLIQQEVIDMLAEAATTATAPGGPDAQEDGAVPPPGSIAARVADITHRAMSGQLPFEAAFRERVRLLAGLPASLFTALRPRLQLSPGVAPLLRALRRLGVRTAVLSGGFQPLTSWLADQLGIHHAHANHVVIETDAATPTPILTGDVTGTIVGRERKRDLLLQIAAAEHIDLRQVVAVGDGANDLLMFQAASLGVAWHAKPLVQLEAGARLNGPTLLDLLYLFGFNSAEIAALSAEEDTP